MASVISITIIVMSVIATSLGQNLRIQFNIMEELSSGSLVGSIANKISPLLQTNYSTNIVYNYLRTSDVARTLFSLNDNLGELFTLVVLDREYLCAHKVDCLYEFDVSIQSGDGQFFQVLTVQVVIDDINDNAPIFPVDNVILKISENSPMGYAANIDTATDKDMGVNNGIQTYELLADLDSIDVFFLNVSRLKISGGFVLKLILNKALDRETKDVYHVIVVAKDGGNEPKSGSVRITISVQDLNDNIPEFASSIYNVSIDDSTAVMETILTLSATDKDLGENGRVTYRFSEFQNDKDTLDHFILNETTGEMKVKSDLTGIAGNTYQVIMEAVDQGIEISLFSQAEVFISIEDSGNNAPIVLVSQMNAGNLGYVNVLENSIVGTFVAYVNVDDPDKGSNGIVECSISNNNFNIVALEKGYKIVVKGLLDREVISFYNVTVSCFDNGTPSLSSSVDIVVQVTDVNDNRPIFNHLNYYATFQENNKGNEVILQVSASDIDEGNSALIHYAADTDALGRFIVDRNSGVVKVNFILDRELQKSITFKVLAIDDGKPALTGTATVILTVEDQNDNAPVFVKSVFNFSIKENQATGTDIGTLKAFDTDSGVNAQFDFSISPDYINQVPFILFPDGLLKTNIQLDHEMTSKYDFVAIVTDHGRNPLSSMAQVTVVVEDLNDNYPIVRYPTPSNNTVIVLYPDYVNTLVTTVQAYDLDERTNKELQYSIRAGNDRRIFKIDPINGTLFLDSQSDIGSDLTVILEISVKDKGDQPLETMATLFISLKYINASFLTSAESESNKHIIISVVVVIITIVISGTIIGTILFLRILDKKRNHKAVNDSRTTTGSDFGFTPATQIHTIISADMLTSQTSECYDAIKKKEVSFVLDTIDYHQKSNGTVFRNKPPKSSQQYSLHIAPDMMQNALSIHDLQNKANVQLHLIKHQKQVLQNCAKHWVQQQQHHSSYHDDHHSDGSAGTFCSDSGRGCSEEDVYSSRSGDDPKVFESSIPALQHGCTLTKTSMPAHTTVPIKTGGSYVKMLWTNQPQPKKPTQSLLTLNRNLYVRNSMPINSVSSNYANIAQKQTSWSNVNYSHGSSMDFSGDSTLQSFFDKTSVMNFPREDDDNYSTTTSGSYTIYSEDIL